jgi:hypothetical protein
VFRKSIIVRLLYVQLRGVLGCLARGKSNLSFDATWIARFPTKKTQKRTMIPYSTLYLCQCNIFFQTTNAEYYTICFCFWTFFNVYDLSDGVWCIFLWFFLFFWVTPILNWPDFRFDCPYLWMRTMKLEYKVLRGFWHSGRTIAVGQNGSKFEFGVVFINSINFWSKESSI